jgi:hypothetical protein
MGNHASMRRLAAFLVKAAISARLLYLSQRRVDLGSVGQRLGGLNFGWVTFILFALCVQILLLALRWREIVAICGARLHLTIALLQLHRPVFQSSLAVDSRR